MLVQNFMTQGVDLIVTLTTPCLTAACTVARNTHIAFTYCYDPVAAGAGKSFSEHLPNVTGVGSFPPVEATVNLIQKLVPGVKSVGTVYSSSEANSVKVISVAREIFQKRGISLQEVTAMNTNEVFQSAQVAWWCARTATRSRSSVMHFSLDPAVLLGLVSIIGAVAIVVGVTVVMEAVSRARGNLPTADEELLPVQPLRLSMPRW